MAQFEGTVYEFTKFLGAYCRIKVMHITTKYRKAKGKCEECGSTTKQLEAAHVRGKERPLIISNILSQYIEKNIVRIDLEEFQERFAEAHYPVEEMIRILCTDCHRAYDKKKDLHEYLPAPENIQDEALIEKMETKESREIQKLMMETLNKSMAIDIINKKSGIDLKSANTLFSNINSAVDVWWLEPHNDKFITGFNFILNFPESRTLFHFQIPSKKINNPKLLFYQRNDSDYSKIFIPKSAFKFIDKKGFDFGTFLVGTIKY